MKTLIFYFFFLNVSSALGGNQNCVKDIQESLSKINHTPKRQKIYLGSVFKDYEYSKNIWNLFGFFNHFQGILYEKELDRYVLTGGDRSSLKAHLIFVNKINGNYIFTKKIDINTSPQNWHPGAPVKFKDSYIIPIEEFWINRQSEILITNFKKKTIFQNIPIATGAVSSYNYNDENILIGFDMFGTNFYKIIDGDIASLELIHKSDEIIFNGSNSIVIDQCDNKKFIISFGNTNFLAPIISGNDFIQLYSFNPKNFTSKLIKTFEVECKSMCHFRGAVNAQVIQNKIQIFATETNKSRSRDFLYLLIFSE